MLPCSLGASLLCRLRGGSEVVLQGDLAEIRGVLEEVEKLVRQHGLSPVVEDEIFVSFLRSEQRTMLIRDLKLFEQSFGIVAVVCCPPHEDDSILLVGDIASVRSAVTEFKNILEFHGVSPIGKRGCLQHKN